MLKIIEEDYFCQICDSSKFDCRFVWKSGQSNWIPFKVYCAVSND
jgi:hypothetical protein